MYLTIYLGKDKQAQARREALEAWAAKLNIYWGGKPSVGRLIQWLADERMEGRWRFSSLGSQEGWNVED